MCLDVERSVGLGDELDDPEPRPVAQSTEHAGDLVYDLVLDHIITPQKLHIMTKPANLGPQVPELLRSE